MPDIATVTRVLQIGVESAPGTAVPANRQLRSISIDPAIQTELQTLRQVGGKYPIASALGKEWIEAELGGYLTYSEIVYPLCSILQAVTPEQITVGGTAYRWVFVPAQSTEDSIKTFTVERGSTIRAVRFAYGLVSGLSITFTRESIELGGSVLGSPLEDNITLTPSPSIVEVVPVSPADVNVYLNDTFTAIGTTKLHRVISAEFEISNRFGPVWVLDATKIGFISHVETEPSAILKLTMEADTDGMRLLSPMRRGDKRFVRIRATGPLIETGSDYTFQLDMCGLVSEVGDFSDEDGIWAISWTLATTYDPAWGKALEVRIINKLSAL